ncbi:MAG: substrate-binding domain-containing protein [Pseudolabrys sp.]
MTVLKILSTHAVMEVVRGLEADFARANSCKLSVHYDPANALKRQIDGGADFDVAILTRAVIDDLAGQSKIIAATCVDLGKSGIGIAFRKGAPKPDISTVDAFKRTLLAASSVVRSRDGASGVYFETVLTRLGIAEAMQGKIKLGGSGRVAEMVARGEVELAVQQISELMPVVGAEMAGPFPAELQLYTLFSAGLSVGCKQPKAAQAFIDCMTAPAATQLYKAAGLEPIN